MTTRHGAAPGREIERLTQAFEAFTVATATLEHAYQALENRAATLTVELEEKNRLLQESLERERLLQEEALRNGRLAAMGEMAATLAHEVRNPLGSMGLFASLLLDDLDDRPGPRRLVSQIAEGIKDLNHLVSNILGFTRSPIPKRGPVDIVAAIEDGLRYTSALLAENRIGIVRRYGDHAVVALADVDLVRQVFLNLTRNAVQAMRGSGTLTVTAEQRDGRIAVSFADTGPGIPGDARARIFAPFFTTKERGTGLGLAVVQTLLEAVGGQITLADGNGEGACFTVILVGAHEEGRRSSTMCVRMDGGDQASAARPAVDGHATVMAAPVPVR